MVKNQKTKKVNYQAEILKGVNKIVELLSSQKTNIVAVKTPEVKLGDGRFIDCGDGTIKDTKTGLMWQKEGSQESMSQKEAEKYCQKSDVGGHKDWRLPTVEELTSIVDYKKYNPAINDVFKCKSDWYWTATDYAGSAGIAWIVGFFTGLVNWGDRGSGYYVRPVRQY